MGNIDDNAHRRRRATAALVLTGALALGACGGDDDDAAAPAADESTSESRRAALDGSDAGFIATDDAADAPVEEPSGDVDPGGGFDIGVIGRDVIVEMRVVLSSDDIQRTVASIMATASSLGGGVASSDVNYGEAGQLGSQGFAVLTVKVPPQSVDRLLERVGDTADVQSINQSAQDVTEQLVNLDVRIQNARQSVTNVREFMDRTENLSELVTLEAELTRRQTELEQLEAQQRNIADRVALSTITIEVVPAASVPDRAAEDDESIGDAFRSGWDAFTAMVFGIAFVLAATLPFLVTGLLLSLVAWMVLRPRDASRRPLAAPDPTIPAPDASSDVSQPETEPDSESQPVG